MLVVQAIRPHVSVDQATTAAISQVQQMNTGSSGYTVVSARYDPAPDKVYDDRGNLSEIATFGPAGPQQAVVGARGFSKATFEYDETGNLVKTYFGANGKLSLQDGRYAKAKCTLDKNDRCSEEWYLDEKNHVILTDIGVAGIKTRYDDRGTLPNVRTLTKTTS